MTRKRFSPKALLALLLEREGKCAECGSKLGGSGGAVEWDHVIPLAMGGENTLDNLQPLCPACHRAKTNTDVGHIAKSKRMKQRAMGIGRQSQKPLPGGRGDKWKRTIDGRTVRR